MSRTPVDAVVVGAGPNGLTAAARLAVAGHSVTVLEANATIGGSCRTLALTGPGSAHDVCAAVHPLAVSSPAFASLGLERHGLRWRHPPVPLVHPLDHGEAVVFDRSVAVTAAGLGADAAAYAELMGPLVARWSAVADGVLAPLVRVPRHPFALARFALAGLPSVERLARRRFRTEAARALLAGTAAHSCLRLDHPLTAALALTLLVAGHHGGWPVAHGGSQAIVDALAAVVRSHGGTMETGRPVRSLADLPAHRVALFDVTPSQLAAITGHPADARLAARWRHGPGAVKLDLALTAPIPWSSDAAHRAGTVHLGGTLEEIALAEAAVVAGRVPERPYVLAAQPHVADPDRPPALWAYTHVPNGWPFDAAGRIEAQLDRYAPGWRDVVAARHVRLASEAEADNANLVGGDIAAGALTGTQFVARPALTRRPHRRRPGVYLCSASTSPGPGVHGMCGWWAAGAALRELS